GGEEAHTNTSTEMPSHTHTQNSHNHTQDAHAHGVQNYSAAGGGKDYATPGGTVPVQNAGVAEKTPATNQTTTAVNQNTGGGGAHNNVQPVIVLNAYIYAGA